MRKLIILIYTLTIISCKDEDTTPQSKADEIVFINFNPDLRIDAVREVQQHSSGCGLVAYPADTIVSDSIPFYLDSLHWFKFIAENRYQFVSASGPCANFQQVLYFYPLNNSDSIAVPHKQTGCALLSEKNDTIHAGLNFNSSGLLHIKIFPSQGFASCPFSGENYLAIKLHDKNSFHYGWIRFETISANGIVIKDAAINKTPDNDILAGQEN